MSCYENLVMKTQMNYSRHYSTYASGGTAVVLSKQKPQRMIVTDETSVYGIDMACFHEKQEEFKKTIQELQEYLQDYDGLIFHRVINGFMIQGGCPDGTGLGGPGYSIKGEFAQNGFANELAHTEGVLSMARAMHPDSAGSQFFIMHKAAPHLDGSYAAFGKIIEGMDIVNKIAETDTDYSDRPLDEQKMKKVTVDTMGTEYPEPEKA